MTLSAFLEEKFGPNCDLVDNWRTPRGGRKITKQQQAAAIKEWQKQASAD